MSKGSLLQAKKSHMLGVWAVLGLDVRQRPDHYSTTCFPRQ